MVGELLFFILAALSLYYFLNICLQSSVKLWQKFYIGVSVWDTSCSIYYKHLKIQYGVMLKYRTENSLYKSFSTNGLVVSPSMYLQQLISQVIQGQWKLWVSSWCFSLTVASCEWETTWECCEQKSPVACLSEKHFSYGCCKHQTQLIQLLVFELQSISLGVAF